MAIGFWQIVVILVLVILIFGTKKLRHLGEDLGAAIKGFKRGLNDENSPEANLQSRNESHQSDTTHSNQK